ncbi:hypothetical protein [Paenisporosarcina sp. TG20]|nr:hypothetical protein [Paenisporosarcina sp. TG20]
MSYKTNRRLSDSHSIVYYGAVILPSEVNQKIDIETGWKTIFY